MSLEMAAHAANRFGFGAKPGELRQIASDPRGWVVSQLTPERAPPPEIAALPPTEDDMLALGRFLVSQRLNANRDNPRVRQRLENEGVTREEMARLSTEESFRAHFRARFEATSTARLNVAIASARPVFERLAHFWSNHFTVSAAKPASAAMPPSFENEAIRPHCLGAFPTLLRAATQHPSMLVYLDNWLSIGPNSAWARNPRMIPRYGFGPGGRPSGLNENLAREVLELHTLGVNGGYTQDDVISLAKIITGWMHERPPVRAYFNEERGTRTGAQLFQFVADAHEPGEKKLLGKAYRHEGLAQGEAALHDLARHPATARFIATKLVRHYVDDSPPSNVVDRVARTFANTEGDLAASMRTLVESPEAWANPFAKYKRPEEYFIACMRALNIPAQAPGVGANGVGAMGQRIFAAPGPNGWADIAVPWLTGDLVWKRIEWAHVLARRVARADIAPLEIGETVMGPLLSSSTRESVKRAESPQQGLVLLLASPEFQRR